jgi:hypothetical protein
LLGEALGLFDGHGFRVFLGELVDAGLGGFAVDEFLNALLLGGVAGGDGFVEGDLALDLGELGLGDVGGVFDGQSFLLVALLLLGDERGEALVLRAVLLGGAFGGGGDGFLIGGEGGGFLLQAGEEVARATVGMLSSAVLTSRAAVSALYLKTSAICRRPMEDMKSESAV